MRKIICLVFLIAGCAGSSSPADMTPAADMTCVPPTFSLACAGDCNDAGTGECVCIPYISDPGTCPCNYGLCEDGGTP